MKSADLTCFADDVRPDLFDRQPFMFKHRLLGHPALEMSNLARMIPTLPGAPGGSSLLAEMKLAALNDGTLHLGAADGPLLTQAAMPYEVTTEAAD